METRWKGIMLLAVICLLAGTAHAGVSKHSSDMLPELNDPKKKKAGEECKTSDECQRHHSCVKTDTKGICTAPVHINIPNT